MAALATSDDVEALWRPLTEVELATIDKKLLLASALVRKHVPSVDARIADGTLDAIIVKAVITNMIQRRYAGDENSGMYRQMSSGAVSYTFATETLGGMGLTASELADLLPSTSMVGTIQLGAALGYPARS